MSMPIWVDQVQVRSDSNPQTFYTVSRRNGTDTWGCSCRGWITHGHCKHLDMLGKTSARAEVKVTSHLNYECPACGHRRSRHFTLLEKAGCTECNEKHGIDSGCVLISDDIIAPYLANVRVIVEEHRNPLCTNWKESPLSLSEARDENERLGWGKFRWQRRAA
jgi:hypothetical protein